MKNFILIFIVFSFQITLSQIKEENIKKGQWLITNQFGGAILEAENELKINVSVFEGLIGREFYLNNKTSLITGVEVLRVRGDYVNMSNQNLFLSNNHINIPLSIRFYNNKQNKISIFGELGIYGSYLLKSEIENTLLNVNSEENGLGFNFGLHLTMGIMYDLDEKWNISIGFKYKSDFVDSYSNNNRVYNITDFYVIQLGLGFKL